MYSNRCWLDWVMRKICFRMTSCCCCSCCCCCCSCCCCFCCCCCRPQWDNCFSWCTLSFPGWLYVKYIARAYSHSTPPCHFMLSQTESRWSRSNGSNKTGIVQFSDSVDLSSQSSGHGFQGYLESLWYRGWRYLHYYACIWLTSGPCFKYHLRKFRLFEGILITINT